MTLDFHNLKTNKISIPAQPDCDEEDTMEEFARRYSIDDHSSF